VFLAHIAGKARRRRGHSADQCHLLIFALLVSQLEAILPVADRLATAKFVDLSLGRRTLGRMGVKFL
jgi:hypothetical protein